MTRLYITICWIDCPKWLLWLRPGFNSCGTGRISNAFSFSAMALGAKRRIPAPTASAETKLKTAAVKVQKNGDRMCGQKGDSKKYVKHVDQKWLICDWYTVLYTHYTLFKSSICFLHITMLIVEHSQRPCTNTRTWRIRPTCSHLIHMLYIK